jgi:hypothetical protein
MRSRLLHGTQHGRLDRDAAGALDVDVVVLARQVFRPPSETPLGDDRREGRGRSCDAWEEYGRDSPKSLEEPMVEIHGQTAAEGTTRRRMLGRAGALAAAGGMAALAGPATAGAHGTGGSLGRFLNFTVTQEQFGVTAVTNAIRKAPGTPSEQFVGVLRAAVTTEFTHVEALEAIGAEPLTSRFWIPDAVFDGGVGLFTSLAAVEAIEVSLYLVGVTIFSLRSDDFGARLCAEALGTEAEHRVLARFAASVLGAPTSPPNNVGFEPFPYKSTREVVQALTGLGIGYGTPGAAPGAFYDYPGDPLANGVGVPVDSPTPE